MAIDKERQHNPRVPLTQPTESGADAGLDPQLAPTIEGGWPSNNRATVEPLPSIESIDSDEDEWDEATEWDQAQIDQTPAVSERGSTEIRKSHWRLPRALRYALTLEVALYGLIIGLAIFTRFYDLSYRALHHDEGVHAYYSWKLFNGQGYEQEPWKHGPFLYHITAFVFWIFGDSDQTTRVSTALFGVLIIPLPALLRKELGRWGALTASFLLLVSPMFLYFSRFLREDIFTAFATFGLFIGLVRFIDRPRAGWWYASMLSLGLLFCTKEVSFFYLALFGGFLFGWLCWQLAPRLLLVLGGYAVVALVVFFFLMALYPPPPIPFEQVTGATLNSYLERLLTHPVFWAFIILGLVGLGVAWFAFREVAVNRRRFMLDRGWADPDTTLAQALFAPYRQEGTVAYAVGWLGRNWKVTLLGFGFAFAFYFVFFTGFFTDIPQGSVGLFSGLWYWMAQQGVARGNQPWYYYFLMLPLYEPLALMMGTLASVFILFKAFRYGLQRQHRTVLMPIAELEEKRPAKKQSEKRPARLDEDDDEFDELDDPSNQAQSTISQKEASNREQNAPTQKPLSPQSSVLPPPPSSETLVEVEVTLRPAGNDLWPGRRRREVHPYFAPLFMVVWAFGSLALYTWASEKMPWLTVQLVLPFIVLAAYLMDGVWGGLEQYFTSGQHREVMLWGIKSQTFFWLQVGGLIGSAFLFYMTMLNLTAAELKLNTGATGRLDWMLVWVPPVIALLFFTALFSFIGMKVAIKATLAVAFGLLTFFLIHTGFTYAFDHGDVALEPGVFVQTTPDLYRVVKELDTVTTILPDLKRTPVLYDSELQTPLDFYLRNYSYKRKVTDFKVLTAATGSALSLNDYQVVMIYSDKIAGLDETQKKALNDNFVRRQYTFNCWYDESQYRNLDLSAQDQIAFLQGKTSKATIRDASSKVVVNKDDVMTNERLQQWATLPGVLDRVYNANGGNSALLHLKWAGKSLYQLRTPGDFTRLWRFVMYREQTQPLGCREWSLYIKKDIAGLWRQYADLVDYPISRPQ